VTITLGVDTLCWHMRLEAGAITPEQVLADAASLDAHVVAVNIHHVRNRSSAQLVELAAHAASLDIRLLASGDFVGSPRHGDEPGVGVERIEGWLEGAVALGSPTLRLASGFYRADLAGHPELIEHERTYVTEVLRRSSAAATSAGIRLILENHSDFTIDEYERIVQEAGPETVGVFLDLINPIMTFDDPFRAIATLAPLARSGHIRDYELISVQQPDAYHRRGFDVRYRYPGEGAAPLRALIDALTATVGDRPYDLLVEGLDSRADVDDQLERLAPAMTLVRSMIEAA